MVGPSSNTRQQPESRGTEKVHLEEETSEISREMDFLLKQIR